MFDSGVLPNADGIVDLMITITMSINPKHYNLDRTLACLSINALSDWTWHISEDIDKRLKSIMTCGKKSGGKKIAMLSTNAEYTPQIFMKFVLGLHLEFIFSVGYMQ